MGSNSWFATRQYTDLPRSHGKPPLSHVGPPKKLTCSMPHPMVASMFHGSSLSLIMRYATLALELSEYIRKQPWWQRSNGIDHFLVVGRTDGGVEFGATRATSTKHVGAYCRKEPLARAKPP
ncbi:unnamed protein product, partial [Ilex paraguariensis]